MLGNGLSNEPFKAPWINIRVLAHRFVGGGPTRASGLSTPEGRPRLEEQVRRGSSPTVCEKEKGGGTLCKITGPHLLMNPWDPQNNESEGPAVVTLTSAWRQASLV